MRAQGFTLIELVIAVAIVAVLATAALPLNELVVQRAKEQDLRRALREIRVAIDAYKQAADEGRLVKRAGESGYPRRLEDLVAGVEDQKSARRDKIYFLRRLPPDPLTEDGKWGLRAYASPPEDPREGEDVFDVFSMASGKGINGRPYREW
jgi:general secretion pathway protein G